MPVAHAGRLAVGEYQLRKTKVEGDAATLLLLQAVGVRAREGLGQPGFTVIYVTRSSNDDMLHSLPPPELTSLVTIAAYSVI